MFWMVKNISNKVIFGVTGKISFEALFDNFKNDFVRGYFLLGVKFFFTLSAMKVQLTSNLFSCSWGSAWSPCSLVQNVFGGLGRFLNTFFLWWLSLLEWELLSLSPLCNSELFEEIWPILSFMSSPNKSWKPGGTSFTKGFRFRSNLCFMRSLHSWLVSRVVMPSTDIEFIMSVKTSLQSLPFSKILSQGITCHHSIRGLDNM